MRLKDRVASDLESKGYIVIRTWRRDSPDIIAFRPANAESILAVEVESTEAKTSTMIDLKSKGVLAQYRPTLETKQTRVHAEILAAEEDYQQAGRFCCNQGLPMDNPFEKGTNNWHRYKANWQIGWEQAQKFAHAMSKMASKPKPPQPD